MIIYKEPIKKQNDETWGQIPVPMFFFCEATKIHGSHGKHGVFRLEILVKDFVQDSCLDLP